MQARIMDALSKGQVLAASPRGALGWRTASGWRELMELGMVRVLPRQVVKADGTAVPFPPGVRRCIRCYVPIRSESPAVRLCVRCRAEIRQIDQTPEAGLCLS